MLPGHGPEFTVAAAEKNFDSWVSAGPAAAGPPTWTKTRTDRGRVLVEQLGFEGMPRRLYACTPTRLSTWLDCPRRYRMTYLDRPAPPKGPPWAHNSLGASVHNALAGWWRLPPPRSGPGGRRAAADRRLDHRGLRGSSPVRRRAGTGPASIVERYVAGLDPAAEPAGVERTVATRTERDRAVRPDRPAGPPPGRPRRGAGHGTGGGRLQDRAAPADHRRRPQLTCRWRCTRWPPGRVLRQPCYRVELHQLHDRARCIGWSTRRSRWQRHLARAEDIAEECAAADAALPGRAAPRARPGVPAAARARAAAGVTSVRTAPRARPPPISGGRGTGWPTSSPGRIRPGPLRRCPLRRCQARRARSARARSARQPAPARPDDAADAPPLAPDRDRPGGAGPRPRPSSRTWSGCSPWSPAPRPRGSAPPPGCRPARRRAAWPSVLYLGRPGVVVLAVQDQHRRAAPARPGPAVRSGQASRYSAIAIRPAGAAPGQPVAQEVDDRHGHALGGACGSRWCLARLGDPLRRAAPGRSAASSASSAWTTCGPRPGQRRRARAQQGQRAEPGGPRQRRCRATSPPKEWPTRCTPRVRAG